MKQFWQVVRLYSHRIVVRIFAIALLPCFVWWLQILPIKEEHKWDAFAGVLAAVAAILIEQLAEVLAQCARFRRLAGRYNCFGYVGENRTEARRVLDINDAELQKRLDDNPDLIYPNGATADITYDGETNLHVTLREGTHQNEWRGDCVMESDSVGIMAWAYAKLGSRDDPWSRNGIKRLSVVDGGSPLRICLHSYSNDGRFGRELLIKDGDHVTGIKGEEWPDNWQLSSFLVCAGIAATITVACFG